MPAAAASSSNDGLDCRSFWRAGSYEVASTPSHPLQALLESSDFDRARVHPKFLHSNATSHKWAFGAIAELLDNAVDEICNGATFVMVDKINNPRDNSYMLLFQDDGGGMDPEGIRRCMSLGFSNKKSKTTIGQCADAIVFSRSNYGSRETQSTGLLSYTFLRRTMKDDIIVPMVDFQIVGGQAVPLTYGSQDDWDDSMKLILECRETQSTGLLSYTFLRRTMKDDIIVPMVDFQIVGGQAVPLTYGSQDDWDDSMKLILEWSPFSSQEQLMKQFADLGSHGTKVLICNLWMNDDGLLELDFDDNDEDILLRDQANTCHVSSSRKEIIQTHISYTLRYSLRAYASILYLRKFSNFQIILRGKPVQQLKIADELKFTKVVTYKPQMGMSSEDVSVRTTIGFAKEAPVLGIFGINVYHKNRLIMPFWKVLQLASSRGRCVVGVLEANFIEPAHDKQDFERTPLFIRLETKLKQIIIDYWRNNCHLIGYQSLNPEIRDRQKGYDKCSEGHRPKTQQSPLAGKHVSVTPPDVRSGAYVEDGIEHVVGLDDDITVLHSKQPRARRSVIEPSELRQGCFQDREELDFVDIPESTSIEQLSEENIQLFGRREELQRKETLLKQTIKNLEREISEAKRNCTRLAAQLEYQKTEGQAL